MNFIRQDSHSDDCFYRLCKVLDSSKIDFLFIDGDHSYDGVKKDYLMYSKLVNKGGVIAFHDIAKDDQPNKVCGVHKFWNEIKSDYKHKEFIDSPEQIGFGIGILLT